MAWNDKSTVRDAGEFAKKHGFEKVVIIGINETTGRIQGVSYGTDAEKCNEAKPLMDAAYDAVYDRLIT